MFEAFAPIHLYALLAAAVAVLTVSSKLYDARGGWFKKWLPFLLVVAAAAHILFLAFLELIAPCGGGWNLAFHSLLLLGVVIIGGVVHADHLIKNAIERNADLPPADSSYDTES